jgi:hypothetical protein
MFKKAKCVFLFATALFSGTCLAETHLLKPNMTIYFNFNPNEPQIIKNPIWWTVSAHCTIDSDDPSNDLSALMLQNTGKVNGIELGEQGSIVVTVHSKEVLEITADAYAWVQITNIGDNKQIVKAVCTT